MSFIKNITSGILKKLKVIFSNPYQEVNVNWVTQKYYKHLAPGKIRTHRLYNRLVYFYSPIELLHGFNEIFIERIYYQELPDNAYVIDCGANIGLSIIYIKRLCPSAEIVAFEPDDTNYSLLLKNIESFDCTGVQLRKEAVWNEDTTLHFSNEGSMSSKVATDTSSKTNEVKAVRLKNLLNRNVDFLKIDIEGAEHEVMTDIADNLHFVEKLFLEYHGAFSQNGELVKMLQIVSAAGFNFYIKEAAPLFDTPFFRIRNPDACYDVQLNIFCFREKKNSESAAVAQG